MTLFFFVSGTKQVPPHTMRTLYREGTFPGGCKGYGNLLTNNEEALYIPRGIVNP